MIQEISKIFTFESSHILPKHPGKCSLLHGHSWKLIVYVKGLVNTETGFVMDYGDLKAVVQPIIDRLDHHCLGDWNADVFPQDISRIQKHMVFGMHNNFYPSSENLIVWIAQQIGDKLDYPIILKPRSLGATTLSQPSYWHKWSKLELNETCTSCCTLTREDYDNSVGNGREDVEATK